MIGLRLHETDKVAMVCNMFNGHVVDWIEPQTGTDPIIDPIIDRIIERGEAERVSGPGLKPGKSPVGRPERESINFIKYNKFRIKQ